jgi:hypothetical protein
VVLSVVTSCNLITGYRRFGGICGFLLHVPNIGKLFPPFCRHETLVGLGSLESETVKYGHESRGTLTSEWLRWWGPAATVNDRTILSSERMLRKDYNGKCSVEKESPGIVDHISLSRIRDSPNMEGQIPVFISPRKMVGQLYPQALGSMFVKKFCL